MYSPRARLGVLVVLIGILAYFGSGLRVSLDLRDALPAGGLTGDAFDDVNRFALLDTLLIDVNGEGAAPEALANAIDALGQRLEARVGTELASVHYRYTLADGAALQAAADPALLALTPVGTLRSRLSPEGLRTHLQRVQAQLFGPAGSLAERQLQSDPLGLAADFRTRLSQRRGPAVLRDGHLLSADGAHGLIIARASTPALGTGPDSPLIRALMADFAQSPLPVDWVGSHRFASEASSQIQAEVQRAVTAGTVGVALVFLLAFRSLRPLLGAVPPLLMGTLFGAATGALVAPVHGIALAFGGALAGLGVDYWIHLYLVGVREPVPASWTERLARGEAAFRELLPAYGISVGATALAFVALATSAYQAVSDLGIIGIGTCIGAFACTALVGPLAFATLARPGDRVPGIPLPFRIPGFVGALGLVALLLLGA